MNLFKNPAEYFAVVYGKLWDCLLIFPDERWQFLFVFTCSQLSLNK